MSANEIFKTEFKGYNKKEVIEYISSLNFKMETLKSELNVAESELRKLREELEQKDTQPQPEIAQVDVEQIRLEAYNQAKAEFESSAKDEELAAKADMYDRQKELIAEIVIKAQSDAQEIQKQAEIKSAELLSDTFDKFQKAKDDFVQMRKNVEAGKAELDTRLAAVAHYLNDFSQYLNILEKDIVNTGDNFKENM